MRDVLDRLGDPAEIVAAARDLDAVDRSAAPEGNPTGPSSGGVGYDGPQFPPPSAPVPSYYRRPRIGLEIAAFALMLAGSIFPPLL